MTQDTSRNFLLAIDPAFGGTGVAVFQGTELISVHTFKRTGKDPFEKRARRIGEEIQNLCESVTSRPGPTGQVTRVVCEFPVFMGSPQRSMGWVKGDLQKLTYLVGVIGGMVGNRVEYTAVPVPEWKGQLPKTVVIDRIKKRLPTPLLKRLNPVKDEWDAIGIGLWALDLF
jgi:hypothetical protein